MLPRAFGCIYFGDIKLGYLQNVILILVNHVPSTEPPGPASDWLKTVYFCWSAFIGHSPHLSTKIECVHTTSTNCLPKECIFEDWIVWMSRDQKWNSTVTPSLLRSLAKAPCQLKMSTEIFLFYFISMGCKWTRLRLIPLRIGFGSDGFRSETENQQQQQRKQQQKSVKTAMKYG